MKNLVNNHFLEKTVPLELDGYRLDQILTQLFPEYSRTYLQQQIKNQRIQVDSQWIDRPRQKLVVNQCIRFYPIFDKVIHEQWVAEPLKLNVVYEDEALLVINKPAGLVVHPAAGHPNHTLVNALLHHFPNLDKLPRAGIIHRLDKDTSGLLVVPKTWAAHTTLIKQLTTRQMSRCYQAIVQGLVITGGEINQPIGRHPIFRQKQAVNTIHGKPAITHYHVLERFRSHTLLKVRLETGRTHQIRVHMTHIGHPILGDPLYGRSFKKSVIKLTKQSSSNQLTNAIQQFSRQALHAYQLGLDHPLTHQYCQWEVPLPDDMKTLLQYFRENEVNNT